MTELKQKHLGRKRNFIIEEKGSRYQRFDEGKFVDSLYKWEEIGFEETITSLLPSRFEYGMFFSILLNSMMFAIPFTLDDDDTVSGIVIRLAIIIVVIFANKLFARKFEKTLIGGYAYIDFFYFDKHQKEVDNFIAILKDEKINFFKKKYLYDEEFENMEAYHEKLKWLFEEEIITKEELKTFKTSNFTLTKK